MTGYKNFAVVGAGEIGGFIIHQLLVDKVAGIINNVVVLTSQGSLASESSGRTHALINYRRDLKPLLTPLPS
jgi:hypothetical protein